MVHSLREVTAWTLREFAFLIQKVYDAYCAVLNQICGGGKKNSRNFDLMKRKNGGGEPGTNSHVISQHNDFALTIK